MMAAEEMDITHTHDLSRGEIAIDLSPSPSISPLLPSQTDGETTLQDLPDSVILHILSFLDYLDVSRTARTCWRLNRVSEDEILWRNIFQRVFKVDPVWLSEPCWNRSWRKEFKRLVDETPMVEAEVLTQHSDQVLHVSFSHDGRRFATSAKDGLIVVWKNGYPVKQEYSKNMKFFSWKYTQFSQFNESDTLLLVSGVLFGQNSTSGEICIFSLQDDFQLQCRVMSKPYDIFGTWYSDMFFLSGRHQWLDNIVSKSVIWLNKASQEADSPRTAVMNELYRFYNPKASSVRSLMIANCVNDSAVNSPVTEKEFEQHNTETSYEEHRSGNPLSNLQRELTERQGAFRGNQEDPGRLDNVANIQYSEAYRSASGELPHAPQIDQGSCSSSSSQNFKSCEEGSPSSSTDDLITSEADNLSECSLSSPDEEKSKPEVSVEDDILDTREKLLIFTCSSETYTPHRIGFKRIKPMYFKSRLDPGPSVQERIAEYNRRRQMEVDGEEEEAINWANYDAVADRFDKIDHVVDLHGHIIGMALSPDHRYLYVNSRPWPEGYRITSPFDPPPIASEIDIHVIDLHTIRKVGMMKRAHRAYTPNEECFFIFLDTCDQFVASGAEDRHGYIWDRHYGIALVKLPHNDVVNSVAFNPVDPHMLVTVSDDFTVKIWRSRDQCRHLGINSIGRKKGTQLYNVKKTPN